METTASPGRLIEVLGGMYSRELGIDLSGPDRTQIFRQFLAAKLMGARISTRVALSTWREFDRRGVDTPGRIRNVLHDRSEGPRDLEARLIGLGKGIGPVTANIFLRKMRSVAGQSAS